MNAHLQTLQFETSLGTAELGWSQQGLTWVRLPRAGRRPLGGALAKVPRVWRKVGERIARALEGRPVDFLDVELDTEGISPFHLEIYRALQQVPFGLTLTYGELAAKAGRPRAARAVGTAMARNRWSIVVPCHRVVRGDGIGGYGGEGGVALKRRLLDLEAQATVEPASRKQARGGAAH